MRVGLRNPLTLAGLILLTVNAERPVK